MLLAVPYLSAAAADLTQLIQLTDYVGVDYAEAVDNGEIINAGEYAEMQDFSAAIVEHVAGLPDSEVSRQLATQAETLNRLVAESASAGEIKSLTTSMRQALINGYDIAVSPRRAPDLAKARGLYSQQCAACHGMTGRGDGPLANTLNPPPINFLDRSRFRERTLLGLYNTIAHGVQGTSMQAYNGLSENERWSLAFYVGQLATTREEQAVGERLWKQGGATQELARLESVTTLTPAEVEANYGKDGLAVVAYLRARPASLFTATDTQPLAYSRTKLAESLATYRAGNREVAYQQAVEAYLEGFELVEGNIDAVDAGLRKEIEAAMTAYRNLVRKGAPVNEVQASLQQIDSLLTTAETKLDETALSGKTALFSAIIILLREGLEALLVVAALAAFLIKTGRRDALVYLYAGVAGAFALGAMTWLAANTVIDISGAQRELTEGFAALFAAVVLFSVGFWMHSKTSAVQWKAFIEHNLQKHLGRGTLWGLAGLSFIAVYRELFEVVLFYQALWMQATAEGQQMIYTGLIIAAALLVVMAWLILRYSTRLPLRQFFAVSGVFMFVLAFIFTGKGIAALQEAGRIPLNPVNMPGIEVLGIYPNLEVIFVQLLLVVVAVLMLYFSESGKGKVSA